MQVTPHDRLRFLVESQSGQRPYLVDLACFNGLGRCDCKDFSVRVAPKLKGGIYEGHRNCKHLSAAWRYFARLCVQKILKEFPDWRDE